MDFYNQRNLVNQGNNFYEREEPSYEQPFDDEQFSDGQEFVDHENQFSSIPREYFQITPGRNQNSSDEDFDDLQGKFIF